MDSNATPTPEIAEWVRSVAATHDPRVGSSTPVFGLLTPALPTRPLAHERSEVYICAGVMVKLHSTNAERGRLARRLYCLGGPDMDRLWIQPLVYAPFEAPGGRLGSLWPRVTVVSTIDAPPWQRAGELLATLHRTPIADDPPAHGGASRLRRTLAWLDANRPDLDRLREIGTDLTRALAGTRMTTWVHGDYHLGQLGHTPLRSSWKLLDADGLGLGDPAWDLGRFAGFWAAGEIDGASWQTFFDAYRAAGGPAVGDGEDLWDAVGASARASLLIAVVKLLETGRDELAVRLIDASVRLAVERPY